MICENSVSNTFPIFGGMTVPRLSVSINTTSFVRKSSDENSSLVMGKLSDSGSWIDLFYVADLPIIW